MEDGKEIQLENLPLDFITIEKPPKYWGYINGKCIFNQDEYDEDIQELELENELYEIQSWFKEKEWIVIKIALNEWDETHRGRIDYLETRKIKRDRHHKIEVLLGRVG